MCLILTGVFGAGTVLTPFGCARRFYHTHATCTGRRDRRSGGSGCVARAPLNKTQASVLVSYFSGHFWRGHCPHAAGRFYHTHATCTGRRDRRSGGSGCVAHAPLNKTQASVLVSYFRVLFWRGHCPNAAWRGETSPHYTHATCTGLRDRRRGGSAWVADAPLNHSRPSLTAGSFDEQWVRRRLCVCSLWAIPYLNE